MTVEELYGQMVDTFQRETGMALAGDGDMAVRLYAVAAQLYALYVQADWVGRQCFPQTAQGDYLDKHAQLRGLERRAATAAVGVLSFETDHPPEADLSIPEGTVCMTAAQVRFETTEAGVCGDGVHRYAHLLPVDVRDDVTLPQSTVPGRGAAALRAGHLGKAHHHYAVGKEFDAHRAAHGDHRPLLRGPGRGRRYQ